MLVHIKFWNNICIELVLLISNTRPLRNLMKSRMNLILFMILSTATLIVGCTSESHPDKNISSGPKPAPKAPTFKQTNNYTTIYDYDVSKDGYGFKKIRTYQHTGDPLRDALHTFFTQSHFKGNYGSLRLANIKMQNNEAVFSFKGKANFKNDKDRALFTMALDSTISYNYPNQTYRIILNTGS